MISVRIEEALLTSSTQTSLQRNQKAVNEQLPGNSKVDLDAKWKSWRRTKAANEVQALLQTASAGKGLCCYCEHDRALQIEHIFNKKLFPQRTFAFSNHLLVCPTCNNRKLDAFAVFEGDTGLAIRFFEKSAPRVAPPTELPVFIDPRNEDPMDYFWLNLSTGFFDIHRKATPRKSKMAEYTRDLLEMNTSKEFIEKRASAVDQYLEILRKYVGCRNSNSIEELVQCFPTRYIPINTGFSLEEAKEIGQKHWTEELGRNHFPTIWLEMKRQYKFNPTVFARLHPEIAKVLQMVPELL